MPHDSRASQNAAGEGLAVRFSANTQLCKGVLASLPAALSPAKLHGDLCSWQIHVTEYDAGGHKKKSGNSKRFLKSQ